ncbi:MAG: hypothetical protein H5U07_07695 [Candidatus Aminicenantes bacterium]|nr:hypothetical protein [Candidatus Aminicenantes bacterium]
MLKWYVINTKPKKEFQVEQLFQQARFVVYHPKYLHEGQIKPFFPGYLFLKFRYPEQYHKVVYTRGVRKIIANRQGPIPLEEEVIECLKKREKNGLIEIMKYGEDPKPGDSIKVVEGPFKGLEGVFLKELSDQERVMILLNYVTYQGKLLIDKNKIKKIKS